MAAPRIKIQGRTYKVPSLDDLSYDDILMLDGELQDRYRSSWAKVQEFVRDTESLSPEQAESHPMATLMGGVTIWMVLRVAGKTEITMREALQIPSTAVEEITMDGPKDHQPKKRKPPKASAPAVVREVPEPEDDSPTSTSSTPTSASA